MDAASGPSYNQANKLKNELCIYGYIRRVEFGIDSFYDYVPEIINDLCLDYYHETKDRFDPDLHGDTLDVTDDMIKSKIPDEHSGDVAFLSNIAKSGTHKWTFEIVKGYEGLIYFGIWKRNYKESEAFQHRLHQHRTYGDKAAYLLYASRGRLRGDIDVQIQRHNYCSKCVIGSVIEMILNMNKGELSFCIDDKDYGKAFDIDTSLSYRAAVNLRSSTVIRLNNYEFDE